MDRRGKENLNDTEINKLTKYIKNKVLADDANINGNYIYDAELFRIEQEKITKDETTIKISMQAISKQQYDYNLAVLLETVYKGGPFDGPSANVPSNISNGALGFFSANSVTYVETTVFKDQNPNQIIFLPATKTGVKKNVGFIRLAYMIETFNLGTYELSGGELPRDWIGFTWKVLDKLNLSSNMANPLVARSLKSHLTYDE